MLSWWKNELGKNKEDQAEEEDMAPVTDTPAAPAPPKKKVVDGKVHKDNFTHSPDIAFIIIWSQNF